MDPEGPLSRVERTLWTVWYYITGAVSRFVRPQPADIVNNDPNSNQESADDIKHPHSDSADDDTGRGGVEEEQHVVTSSLLSSSQPVVTWERCTTEIDLGPDEESIQYKTQLRTGDESKEDGQGTREEQHGQTGNDNSNDSRAKEDEQETMEIGKLHTCAGLATPEDDEHEHVDTGPRNLPEFAISEERIEGETDAEKETVRSVTPDDHPAKEETMKETQVKEEKDQMHDKEEQDLEAEDTEVKVCVITSLSPEEEDHVHEEEAEGWRNDAVTPDDHPKTDKIIKEIQLKEEDQMHHEEEHDLEAETIEVAEEDDKTDQEDEQDLEAEDTEMKVCITTDVRPVQDDHMHETESEVQKNDAVMLDDHPREGETIKETQLEEEDDKMHHEEEQDLETEDTEVQVCIIKGLRPEDDDDMQEIESEVQWNDVVTPDDHPTTDEIIKEIQLEEEEDKMHHEEEQDLKAEDTEMKVCITTDVRPVQDDHMHETESEVQKNDAVTLDDHPREDESIKEIQLEEDDDKMHHEEEQDLETETCGVMLQPASENVNKWDEKTNQVENQLSAFGELPDASVDELILVRQHPVMAHRSENDEDEKEKEGETEQHAATEKENTDEAAASERIEVPERDENIRTVAEGTEGENLLTEYDASSKEAAQKNTAQLHTAEFTDKDDVRVPAVQTKTRQTGVTIADVSVHERLVDQDHEKGERVSSEAYTEECHKEIVHLSTSVTVKPEGETAQETSEEFKNMPLGISQGQFAVSQELNTTACEEIQEGVAKYNNALRGADENTTQRFLEAGDCEEIPTNQLPEEVESGEWESLQNSGCSTGADYLLLKESMEEKQESKDETETNFDLVVEEHSEILDLAREVEKALVEGVIQELGHLFAKEEGKLLTSSMKTEITEKPVGLADETERRSEGLHGGTERSSFSKEASATGSDYETKDAVVVAAAEVVAIQELAQAINLEQSISRLSSLQEDMTESGFVRLSVETEPKSLDDMQDEAIKREERGCGDEGEEAEDGIWSTNEMENLHLRVTETAGELITERREKESLLNAESELSQPSETQEIKNQSPDRALEISETQIIAVTETADESGTSEPRAKDLPVMSSEVKGSSASGHQDVIDEEILDLWIETAMSEDTDEIKKEEPEPGQLLDTKTDTLNEERGEISPEKEKEKELPAEPISRETEPVSDTEMSSSTVESGFLDQSLSESGAQSSETRLPKSTSTDSLQEIHDLMSADISEVTAQPQPQSESQDILTEESAETEKESITDTGVPSPEGKHLNQESQEKAYEDVEETDVTTLTKTSAPSQVQKAKAEEEHLENEVDAPVLDFAMQRSRIAVKNPCVRRPKNPRSLLHMPSAEPTPTPTPSLPLPVKVPAGVPLGGMGIGIKLPGLGAGFPVLKKTQRAVREENTQETVSQEPETKPEEKSDAPQQDEEPKKPKWMPPKHPGFGNPLMAELKTKLKKTPQE